MKLRKLTCPNCQGMLDMNIADNKQIFCPYCGQKFLIDDERIHIEITQNINKTKRIVDDAEIIRAKNEEKIERIRADAKMVSLGFKLIGFLMAIMFAMVLISVIRDALEGVGRDEPYVKTLSSSFDYKWDNYVEVIDDLENAGFTNITTVDLNDASLLKKEGSVNKVTIAGEDSFSEDQEFPLSSEVVIYYH